MTTSGYYASHGAWSDPSQFALPPWSSDLHVLSRAINTIIRHPVGRSPVPFTEAQRQDLLLRTASELMRNSEILQVANRDGLTDASRLCA
jgi:hypothetical protein